MTPFEFPPLPEPMRAIDGAPVGSLTPEQCRAYAQQVLDLWTRVKGEAVLRVESNGAAGVEIVQVYSPLPLGQQDLYSAPPEREPLTDEALWEMWIHSPSDVLVFARRIEAAHGIVSHESDKVKK